MGLDTFWPDPENDPYLFENDLRRQGYALVAGLDEVGRGPLAGPVVAACVVLPVDCRSRALIDSKKLSHGDRVRLSAELYGMEAMISTASVSETEIDQLNILQASLLAMKRAVLSLERRPDFLLVDGKFPVPLAIPQKTLIKGESKSASIAAASIVAKVYRDALMEEYHLHYPEYNFSKNKGYPTKEHRLAVKKHGPCLIHRRSFKGVKEFYEVPGQEDTPEQDRRRLLF